MLLLTLMLAVQTRRRLKDADRAGSHAGCRTAHTRQSRTEALKMHRHKPTPFSARSAPGKPRNLSLYWKLWPVGSLSKYLVRGFSPISPIWTITGLNSLFNHRRHAPLPLSNSNIGDPQRQRKGYCDIMWVNDLITIAAEKWRGTNWRLNIIHSLQKKMLTCFCVCSFMYLSCFLFLFSLLVSWLLIGTQDV